MMQNSPNQGKKYVMGSDNDADLATPVSEIGNKAMFFAGHERVQPSAKLDLEYLSFSLIIWGLGPTRWS